MEKKYIDIFAGCGGLSLGLHNAGWRGVFAVEKNEEAFATLKYNLIDQLKHFEWVDWLEMENHDINVLLKQHERKGTISCWRAALPGIFYGRTEKC